MSVDEEADPGGLGEHDSEGLLPEAVAGAVQIGLAELAKLDAVVAEAEARFVAAREKLSPRRRFGVRREDGFARVLEGVVADLRNGLVESRRVASTFNIAFFGRTGAGKSTLLSALGGLSGELVSDVAVTSRPTSSPWIGKDAASTTHLASMDGGALTPAPSWRRRPGRPSRSLTLCCSVSTARASKPQSSAR